MARQDLGFDVFAHDKTGRTFAKLAQSVERLSDKLKELDRQSANPEIDVDTQKAMAQARRAAAAFAKGAEDEGAKRKRGFFAAMFTPDAGVIRALRTGIPAALGSPIGLAALTLGGVFAASFVAAVLASGAFAAVAGGFTAIAAVAVKENERIRASFGDLAQTVQTDLRQAANPLVPAFDTALQQVRRMFGPHIREPLERIFAGLEPTIVPFVQSAVRTVGAVLDDLATPQFLEGMRTVLTAISNELPRLGDAVGDAFVTLAENADDIAEAFGHIVTITAAVIDAVAVLTNKFTDAFNTISSGLEKVFGASDDFFNSAVGKALRWSNALALVNFETEETGKAAGRAGEKVDGMTGSMGGADASSEALALRQKQLTDAIDGTNERLEHEQEKLEQLKDSMFASAEGVLSLREAEVAYQEQLDTTRETLEENGKTLDINTEKGQENRRAIDDQAESALEQIQAMIEQGKSTKQVTKFTARARDQFIRAAQAAGMEKDEARRLANQLGLVPSEVETRIQAIDQMSGTINHLKRQLRELQRQAGVIPIGTSTGAFFGSSLIRPQDFHTGGMIGPEIPRAHSGLLLRPDERVVIGQTGERILSRPQTAALDAQGGVEALMRGGMGNGPMVIENHIEIGGEVVRTVRTEISASNRDTRRRTRQGQGVAR